MLHDVSSLGAVGPGPSCSDLSNPKTRGHRTMRVADSLSGDWVSTSLSDSQSPDRAFAPHPDSVIAFNTLIENLQDPPPLSPCTAIDAPRPHLTLACHFGSCPGGPRHVPGQALVLHALAVGIGRRSRSQQRLRIRVRQTPLSRGLLSMLNFGTVAGFSKRCRTDWITRYFSRLEDFHG